MSDANKLTIESLRAVMDEIRDRPPRPPTYTVHPARKARYEADVAAGMDVGEAFARMLASEAAAVATLDPRRIFEAVSDDA